MSNDGSNYSSQNRPYSYEKTHHTPSYPSRRRKPYAPRRRSSGGGNGKIWAVAVISLVLIAGAVVLGATLERGGVFEPKKIVDVPSDIQLVDENEGVSSALPLQGGITLLPLEKVKCQSYIVIDKVTGQTILEKNSTEKIYPASTAKIMTALLAAEQGQPDKKITASQTAIESLPSDASMMGLLAGEETTLDELMYGLLLPSGCDAANVIAEGISGTQTKFVEGMNSKASALGLEGTHFTNPSGLHDEALYTTSADLAKLSAAASKNAWYSRVVAATDHAYTATNKHSYDGWRIAANSNRLLDKSYLFGQEGMIISVTGAKTGSHSLAGFNLVCTATTRNGTELVAVINNIAHDQGRGANFLAPYMAALLNAAAKETEKGAAATYLTAGQALPAGLVHGKLPDRVVLVPERSYSVVGGAALPSDTDSSSENAEQATSPDGQNSPTLTVGAVTITFVPDAQYALKLKQLDPGEDKRVGCITVTDSDGNKLCEDILVRAKFQ